MGASYRPHAMFCQGKKCSRFQYPVSFSKKLGAVGNVHRDVLSVRPVENTIRIRQVLAVSLHNRDLALHVEQCRQFVCRFDESWSDVDPADRALKAAREIPRGATEAAPNVKDMVTGLDGQAVGKLNGSGEPARMKMIDRSQVLHGQLMQRFAYVLQCRQD
jgi:hypothetical protein